MIVLTVLSRSFAVQWQVNIKVWFHYFSKRLTVEYCLKITTQRSFSISCVLISLWLLSHSFISKLKWIRCVLLFFLNGKKCISNLLNMMVFIEQAILQDSVGFRVIIHVIRGYKVGSLFGCCLFYPVWPMRWSNIISSWKPFMWVNSTPSAVSHMDDQPPWEPSKGWEHVPLGSSLAQQDQLQILNTPLRGKLSFLPVWWVI